MKKPKPELTAKAIGSIANASQSAKRLRADLMTLSAALTVEGNGTVAERLAIDALMGVLMDFAKVSNAIASLKVSTYYISTK
jgi:hypothetical protein